MRARALCVPFAAALLAAAPFAQVVERPTPHQTLPEFLGWVPDELVLVFEPESARGLVVSSEVGMPPLANEATLQVVLDATGALEIRRQFPSARPQAPGSSLPDLTGHYKVRIAPGVRIEDAAAAYSLVPGMDHVEPIGLHTLYQTPNDTYYQGTPNPSFPYDQWHLWNNDSVDAEQAWDSVTGDPSVLVGILDSGVRYFHADLGGPSAPWGPSNPYSGGNVFINPGEIPGNGQDDDGNGFVDDTVGWDFVSSAGGQGVQCIDQDCSGADNDPDDGDGHGTHVAGTVGAITNNNFLVAGVAGGFSDGSGIGNGVSIVPMRIGYHAKYQGVTTGIVRMDWAAEAMNYLADLVDAGHNVASINCSWGSSNSGGLNAAVNNLQAHDVVICHAAGNSGSSGSDFLGSKAGVLSVAATDINGNGANFSNHGSWVEVAAPGVAVVSTFRNPDDPDPTAHYISVLDGTSMAAPHVAGVVALLESCDSGLTAAQKRTLVTANVDPYNDPRDLGSGIVNAKLAIDATGCGTPCDLSADFSASTTAGCSALSVTFTDLTSGPATSWSWDFGDGNGSGLQNPTHSYAAAGTYSVSLTATSSACSDAVTKSGFITVSSSPIADFNASSTSGIVPFSVNFSDASGGNPTSWSWSFGDGGTSTAQNPSHTYTAAGTYTVSLSATNACGADSLTRTGYITVTDPGPSTTMHVQAISIVTVNESKGFKHAEATVTIVDNNGQPVSGATVTGDFSGKTSDAGVSGATNAAGQVTLSSSSAKGGGSWCFTVTGVSHGTLSYAPGDNVLTTGCQ